jgi:hypothetical protein
VLYLILKGLSIIFDTGFGRNTEFSMLETSSKSGQIA